MRRPLVRYLAPIAGGILALSCALDRIHESADGGLLVRFVVEGANRPLVESASGGAARRSSGSTESAASDPDTIRVEVHDARGERIASETVGYSGTGDDAVEMLLPVARDLTVLLSGEGEGPDGRGALYFGQQPGIAIERGRTTEATVLLSWSVAEIDTIEGDAGYPTYTVRWRRVPWATSYLLREYTVDGSSDFTTTADDTFRTFRPGVENGSARLPRGFQGAARRFAMPSRAASPAATGPVGYRVRAGLPMGHGIFGDSASVDLSLWYDLPSVLSIVPADSSTGVLDTGEITIEFNRPMEPAQGPDTLVTVRASSSGEVVAVSRTWSDRYLTLRHDEPFLRGEEYRVRVSTGLHDEQGRPLDQDPAREGLQAFVSFFRVEEYDPVRVTAVSPIDGATTVPTTTGVSLHLLRAIVRATVTESSFTLVGPTGAIPSSRGIGAGDTLLTLTPLQELQYDTDYAVHLETTVLDASRGEPLDQNPLAAGFQPFASTFRTQTQPRGPSIASTTPSLGETNHPVYEPVVIEFDRAIRTDTFRPADTVLLQRNLNGLWVNVVTEPGPYSTDGQRFTLFPTQDLKRDTAHRLIVRGGPAGIRDAGGIPFDADYETAGYQDFEVGFSTELNVKVTSSFPVDGAGQVPWDVEVRLTLDGAIQAESVSDTTFGLLLGGAAVAGTRWISSDQREIRFRPAAPLDGYRDYTIWVGTGLRSARGGSFDQEYTLAGHQGFTSRFTTVEEQVPPRVESIAPADAALGIPLDQRVAVVFSEPVRSFLVPDNFYLTAADSAGARVGATVTVSADGRSAELRPTSPLVAQTVYHVHVDPAVTDLFGNGLDQDLSKPGKQKFHSVFTTVPERIPPTVVSVIPPDGSSGASVDGVVTIDFSEPIDRASVTGALRIGIESGSHPGGITFEDGDRRAVWTPTWSLLHNAIYTVFVDTLLVDLAGNRLDQFPDAGHPGNDPFVSHFSTAPDLQGPRLLSVAPDDGASGVAIDMNPILSFSEAVDPSSVIPNGIELADSLGQAVVFSPVLSTDGREITLVHIPPFAFETRYRITVNPDLTDTQGNPFDDDPAIAGNQSRTATFRTQFENIPPRVDDVVPADLATGVALTQAVTVGFSEPCDPGTIDATTFRLLVSDTSVPGLRSITADGDSATFTPSDTLSYGTRYDIRVEGVKDLKGNLLDQEDSVGGDQPFLSSFTTLPQPAPAPRVVSTTPADGALDVSPLIHPRIVFSRPMDDSTFTAANPGLLRKGVAVTATRAGEPGDTAFVFTPLAPLERGSYSWYVTSTLKDQDGHPLDQDPATPGSDWFTGGFEVGKRPVADAGPGVCSDGSDLAISFDGRGSSDPDGAIAHVRVTWSWGDGTTSTVQDSSGLRATHSYPCADIKGCDGIDNDGDGSTDETGPNGCDESYRVIMTIEDEDGLRSADTTGVAFCAFLARYSVPANGVTGVDTLQTVRVWLSSACDPLTVDTTSVWLALEGGGKVGATRSVEDQGRVLVLDPVVPMLPDTTYTILVTGSLRSASGAALDQALCTDGIQEFVASFRTIPRAGPLPFGVKRRPAAAGRPASPQSAR
jgi:hypothetical protein